MNWISVNEKSPDKNGKYLVLRKYKIFNKDISTTDFDIACYDNKTNTWKKYDRYITITHWCPINLENINLTEEDD